MKNSDESSKNKIKTGLLVLSILGILFVGKWIVFPSAQASGFTFGSGPETPNMAVVNNGIQEVSIDLKSRAYEPIVVQKGVPVRFNIKATAESINGCNGTVIIPAFNIEKSLVPGDNVIEFTPTEEGTIGYSCWMGMIGSSIQVVSNLDTASVTALPNQGAGGFGSSCCDLPQ
jgi:heme/copper-type cytochrome/quinol oxidase subunit 2